MMQTFFITGTDTDAGKTYVSCLLLQGLAALHQPAIGLKPIAAGVDADGLNADAKALQACSGLALNYAQVNPQLLALPVAPHLAAAQQQQLLSFARLDAQLQQTAELPAKFRLIEGAGGWLLPLNDQQYLADWVIKCQFPVVLVVAMKLGCLNHAMLTARELQRSGIRVLGWVANCVDPQMLLLTENVADLTARLPWPRLAVLPYQSSPAPALAGELTSQLLAQL